MGTPYMAPWMAGLTPPLVEPPIVVVFCLFISSILIFPCLSREVAKSVISNNNFCDNHPERFKVPNKATCAPAKPRTRYLSSGCLILLDTSRLSPQYRLRHHGRRSSVEFYPAADRRPQPVATGPPTGRPWTIIPPNPRTERVSQQPSLIRCSRLCGGSSICRK